VGTLTEIWIPVKKVVDHKTLLKAPRFKNFFVATETTEKLHQNNNNNNNNNNNTGSDTT
jgi:hypothetical protein